MWLKDNSVMAFDYCFKFGDRVEYRKYISPGSMAYDYCLKIYDCDMYPMAKAMGFNLI